jgi:hypothetical protein
LAGCATAAIGLLDGAALLASPGFVLHHEQLLEAPRHVAEISVDQLDAAIQVRARALSAEEPANETVVLSHEVVQTPAKFPDMRQDFRICDARGSISFSV